MIIFFCSISGATQAVQNAGLALITLFAGYIKDADETYVWLEIFYIAWLGVSILATAMLAFTDFRKHNYLLMSDKQRKVFETTPEYFKAMQIDMPTTLTNNGEINGGYDGNDGMLENE